MSSDANWPSRHQQPRRKPLPVEAVWHEGPRNDAWEELWRRIFSEVLRGTTHIVQSNTNGRGPTHRE